MNDSSKPIVLITGVNGNVGRALAATLQTDYRIVGCVQKEPRENQVALDLSSDESVQKAIATIKERYSSHLAAVVHLAAYFDFSGEESELYRKVNVEGTERLLRALGQLDVERFIYASTMLVHAPVEQPGRVDESTPLAPKWAYPRSKAQTEAVIEREHGAMPFTILRLAGLYDENSGVPTLTQQIARIYEKDFKSHLYSGDTSAGQAFIHKEDMVDVFKRVIERRKELPKENYILAGETDVMSYDELQDEIGKLIHGERDWATLKVPSPLAKAGAWMEDAAEPLIPDDFDEGKRPFIKPFMIELSSDHYALDISRATEQLGWAPRHSIRTTLPAMIQKLKEDPARWYAQNKIAPPLWMRSATEESRDPERLRREYQRWYENKHYDNLWAPFINIALGLWLITSPFILGYGGGAMMWSDLIAGTLVVICALFTLSPAKWMRPARFDVAAIGLWVTFAPLLFWTPSAAALLNGTLVGALLMGFAFLIRPYPFMSPTALLGPEIPPGWSFSPSSWLQRLPIIVLACIGFFISRYLTAYQLGHIDTVWEPFFTTGAIANDGKNGTAEIITSAVSEAWPVPDAGVGALTYLLEILTGLIGSSARWRTMPWLVLLFGALIVPLGFVSLTFIVIQPILLGTWCTLCLIAAAAMLIQIPYSFDEILATIGFLRRRARAGRPWMKVLFLGDTDDGEPARPHNEFRQPLGHMLRESFTGGVSVPWNLLLCVLIGVWLLCTRLTIGSSGAMANVDHLIGCLVLTVSITAFAEVVRIVRYLNVALGLALVAVPFVIGATIVPTISAVVCGLGLIVLSLPRGKIRARWGEWTPIIR